MTETAKMVFETIIRYEIAGYSCFFAPENAVVPISNIVFHKPELTKYKARKALKELICEDLIFYTSQGQPALVSSGEYKELICEAQPPKNGYALTKKGFESELFRQKYKSWEASLNCFST